MSRRADKPPRKKEHTHQLLDEDAEDDRDAPRPAFSARGNRSQDEKMERTALLRSQGASGDDIQTLPVGEVTQVYSRYCQVAHSTGTRRCVVRKTLTKLEKTAIIVGDEVRFRDGKPGEEPVVEQVLPRRTVLTRADSFHDNRQHPIVANAQQMLIVASLKHPEIKWSLIDRMIVAAKSGHLDPIICLNKMDLADDTEFADAALAHYESLGVRCIKASVVNNIGLDAVAEVLKEKSTVLAGHSGVGKSSLIAAIQPGLDIRIGPVSDYTAKGRHTTTSARRYDLSAGGCVIDTPGVKLFGLWNVTQENLLEYFPDVQAQTAPDWRSESYQRIAASLKR